MENFIVCLNAVAPIFIIIALGYMARRLGDIKREDVFRFNRLIFRYFIPVMVFYNIYVSDLAASFNVKLLCFCAVRSAGRMVCQHADSQADRATT